MERIKGFLSSSLTQKQQKLRLCLLKGTIVVVLITTILTAVATIYRWPFLMHDAWTYTALGLVLVYVVASFSIILFTRHRRDGSPIMRALVVILIIGINMGLMHSASIESSAHVIYALVLALCILIVMCALAQWLPARFVTPTYAFCFICLGVSAIGNIVGGLFYSMTDAPGELTSQFFLSSFAILVFSLFIAVDSSYYSLRCRGGNCCENGIISIWIDFANVISNTMHFLGVGLWLDIANALASTVDLVDVVEWSKEELHND